MNTSTAASRHVVGYANRNLVQLQTVTDRKLFGTNTLVDDFTKSLSQVETLDGGWATKYLDNSTGHQWLKYVVDDRGFFVNLIFSPLGPARAFRNRI